KLIAGESAWNIEKLWRRMYITEENTLGGTLYAAISAIDIALWDIVGKSLGAPVYKMIGGKIHPTIRVYASYRWGDIPRTAEAFDPFFLEEPVPPENVDAMAALQRSTNIPIATGEGLQSHFNFHEVLTKQAARILQPDVARTGGITAMKKIAAMADAHYVTFA